MTIKPISPGDAIKAKAKTIPDFVYEAFNEIISENATKSGPNVYSSFRQDDVVAIIVRKMIEQSVLTDDSPSANRDHMYSKGWLDVEDSYRTEGWSVDYDRPGYNESYAASFKFSSKK